MAGAVSSGRYRAGWCGGEVRRLRFGRALRENILESGGGEDRGGGFEERAAVDWHGGMVKHGRGTRKQTSVERSARPIA